MLNRKYETLLKILMHETNHINSSMLASQMNISIRSIKSYVHDINLLQPNTISSSKDGYLLDKEKGYLLLFKNSINIPQNSKERVIYIIRHLIQEKKDAYELCEALFISISTLKSDLTKVRHKISKFHLSLINKNDVINIEGLEVNKRKLLSSILYNESNINFVNLEAIQNNFKDIDILLIENILTDIFNDHSFFINDYSLINLVLHITITIDRLNNDNISIISSDYNPSLITHNEYNLAAEVCHVLEENFNVIFPASEIHELAILIVSRGTSLNYQNINKNNLYQFIDKQVMILVYKLIDTVNDVYSIDLSETEFLIRFALHIQNLLIRSKNLRFSKNPLINEIKSGCPLIYDAAVHLSSIIKKETGVTINDDEIAYIAFHIGSTIEAQKELQNKITAILFCSNYYDMSIRIVNSINNHFATQLLIKNIVNSINDIDENNIDLIISTNPLKSGTNKANYLQISIFVNNTDIMNIEKKIKHIKKFKQKTEFKNDLNQLLSEQLFEINKQLKTKDEILNYMSNKLVNLGYVNDNFINELRERENISSTAYSNFSIPHAIKMNAHKTGIYILTSNQTIDWDGHHLRLVLMMCFNSRERHLFNKIFEPITIALTNPENISKLLQCNNYQEFIDKLVEFAFE